MKFKTLLLLLGLMGAACCCNDDCMFATTYHHQHFNHVSELQNSSVAPWTLKVESVEGREPQFLQNAVCMRCTLAHMAAKAIKIKIQVYQRYNSSHWCKCPYEMAVGCTCVHKQSK